MKQSLWEKFVCELYQPRNVETGVTDLRWKMFMRTQCEPEKLPPTKGALLKTIKRAHYQSIVWHRCNLANQSLPPPTNYGWSVKDGYYEPIASLDNFAPSNLANFIRCNCKVSKCSGVCSCRSQGVTCTEMCNCGAEDEDCHNILNNDQSEDNDVEDSGLTL